MVELDLYLLEKLYLIAHVFLLNLSTCHQVVYSFIDPLDLTLCGSQLRQM